MKKLLLLISFVFAGSALNAYTIKFINKTGAPLAGRVSTVAGGMFPINSNGVVDIKGFCFAAASVNAGGKSGIIVSEKNALGINMTCGSLTYEVTVNGNKLAIRKK